MALILLDADCEGHNGPNFKCGEVAAYAVLLNEYYRYACRLHLAQQLDSIYRNHGVTTVRVVQMRRR